MSPATTYLRAALPMIPGASRLPFVAGGGGEMPDLERRRGGVEIDPAHLAVYNKVCGFRLRDEVPATYPHVLAFGLHMALMTDGRFPFPAIGLVHICNRITQHRPVRLGDELDLHVAPTSVEPHPKGRRFSICTNVRVDGDVVWEATSTILRRGDGTGESEERGFEPSPVQAEWRLPGDLGRRYAGVSGDSNPIHLHPLTSRAFGFTRPIAHGMWTKARCLAAMEARLPDAFTVEVAFRKPILLPGRVGFGAEDERFSVRDPKSGSSHLDGTLTPA